ncbi:MAG: hypothetical protein JW967_01575 [Dehalococcoidales bacterium]|nr:hypothetical protein [Dehalococcoidales bacterium]
MSIKDDTTDILLIGAAAGGAYLLYKTGAFNFWSKATSGEWGEEAYEAISSGDPYNPSFAEKIVWAFSNTPAWQLALGGPLVAIYKAIFQNGGVAQVNKTACDAAFAKVGLTTDQVIALDKVYGYTFVTKLIVDIARGNALTAAQVAAYQSVGGVYTGV